MMRAALRLVLVASFGLPACALESTPLVTPDATVADRPDGGATPDDTAAVDTGPEVFVDRAAPRDLPPDDVDQTCANGATDRCLAMPPGPCPDLGDQAAHVVHFAGFVQDSAPSCAGTMTSMGPDAVLPLTITTVSDVDVEVAPGTGDAVVVALYPADGCGERAREMACINGSSSIGGIATFRASSVMPGRYAVVVATARGGDARVQVQLSRARLRPPGDLCPGLVAVPDGDALTIDTRHFVTYSDYGTSCGRLASGQFGWADAVFSYTVATPRDVTVTVEGSATDALYMEATVVCGSPTQAIPGCETGGPVAHTFHNQQPGTYWVTVEHHFDVAPTQVLTARVTTAPPTPPGPAATCPGVALAQGVAGVVDTGLVTPGPALACLAHRSAGAFWNLTVPAGGSDLLVNVATNATRGNAAVQVLASCDATTDLGCVGPGNRTASSVWTRVSGAAAGAPLVVHGATDAAGGTLTARWYAVPPPAHAATTDNFTCATATMIPATGGVFTGSTTTATAVASPACATSSSGCAGARGALYQLNLTQMRRVVAILHAADFDALLSIAGGTTCPGRAFPPMCNDDWYGTDSQVDATLMPGSYWIYAAGCGPTQAGDYTLEVSVLPP